MSFSCEPCQLGKSHRPSLPSIHVSSSHMFDLIYSDVWTTPLLSLHGNRYFVLFLNDHSKFMWIYFITYKSQVFTIIFQQFKNIIKTQFATKITSNLLEWGVSKCLKIC